MAASIPTGVHLVGSVPLADAETVFREVAHVLGHHLDRMPDGETGERKNWIAWQYPMMTKTPGLEPIPAGERIYLRRQMVRRVPHSNTPLRFGSLGYASAAVASFALFDRLQRQGVIPGGVRFQVSLPTPLGPITTFVTPEDRIEIEPAYEEAMLREVLEISASIPHDKLALQWDVSAELGHLEGVWPAHFQDLEHGILARLERLGRAVPRDVQLGYHLCYGDFGHKHFLNPADSHLLVGMANALSAFERQLDWIHMPIPIGWTDPKSYGPLGRLRLQPQTKLYLGVVHVADGLIGAWQRIARAAEWVHPFGIATECGWGRRPPETVAELLKLHAELAAPLR